MDKLKADVELACWLDGRFILRSGQRTNRYFDKYQFESNPAMLAALVDRLHSCIPPETDVLAGVDMGGIPIATALSLKLDLPAVYVRKQAKKYGTCRQVEGVSVTGKRVLVVEDVISTGGAVKLAIDALCKQGADVVGSLVVMNRSNPMLTHLGGKPLFQLWPN